jgi:hypothetical protein
MSIRAEICGALCNQPMRATNDYSGMDCAIAARIRLVADSDNSTLQDHCIDFRPQGTSPPALRLADLFDTGAGGAKLLALGGAPSVPFDVEISLYAPGSIPCNDGQPLVGFGTSGSTELGDNPVLVPIGCRDACEIHSNVTVQLLAAENPATLIDPSTPVQLGEIFPYDLFASTEGLCTFPPETAHDGEFRSFAMMQSGANLDGTWIADPYPPDTYAGCTAMAAMVNGGRQLACVFNDNTSRATLVGFVLSASHLAAVQSFNQSQHATHGALVIRVLDTSSNSAIGARVLWSLQTNQAEAEYPPDSSWAIVPPTIVGTTAAGLGAALIADAPTGPYTVQFSDGATRTVNAGGSDDVNSVTVVLVQHP